MVETTTPPAKSLKLRLLAAAVAVAAVVVVLKLTGALDYLSFAVLARNREWLVGRVEELGFGAPIVFILVCAVCTALSVGPRELAVDGTRIRARRFVIATGSSAAIPPIPGLDRVPYFRNETVFVLNRPSG